MTSEPASEPDALPAVSFAGVSVLRDGRAILDAIDWEVSPKDRWVILGPNGSGKTTLLQVAGARMMPSRGVVKVVGEHFGRSDLRTLRARVSLVSAATQWSVRAFLSAREVVVTGKDGTLFPLEHRYTQRDWAAADRTLLRVLGSAATHLSDAAFGVLSEGERQQVLIARSLMGTAELVLLDEPASGLDLAARERLVTRMGSLARDPGVPAVVLVTHHLEEVPPGFTHGLLLAAGRVVAAGRLEDVLTEPLVSKCFGVRVRVGQRDGRWWAHAAL